MLSRTMFTIEYIHQLRENTGYDPQLLERVIYAFGLLEAIRKVELPFCFKGGTSLMLLLEHPKRLSTDIDIIVEPGIDIEEYISKAGTIFPFRKVEEIPRTGNGNIQGLSAELSNNSQFFPRSLCGEAGLYLFRRRNS